MGFIGTIEMLFFFEPNGPTIHHITGPISDTHTITAAVGDTHVITGEVE